MYHVTAKENNTVILPCKVNGYPPPAVTWSKDSDVTAINKGLMTVNGLVLVDVHVGDTGNYTCKAESILGVQEKVVELIVKGIFYSDIFLGFFSCEMDAYLSLILFKISLICEKFKFNYTYRR